MSNIDLQYKRYQHDRWLHQNINQSLVDQAVEKLVALSIGHCFVLRSGMTVVKPAN
jgi:hypothetical protein